MSGGESGRGDRVDYVQRTPAAAGAVLLSGLYLWAFRHEWSVAIPAFLFASFLGLLGAGLFWVAVERGHEEPHVTGWFLAAAGTIALVVGLAAWGSGEWLGWRTAFGSVVAGAGIGAWLVFVRIAVRGVPDSRPDDDESA